MAAVKKSVKIPAKLSVGEETLALHIRAEKLPPPKREFKFHGIRDWRFDFAWPDLMLAVEVDGGTRFGKSRHTRHEGFQEDCVKKNTAQLTGWKVLTFTTQMVNSGAAIRVIKDAIKT